MTHNTVDDYRAEKAQTQAESIGWIPLEKGTITIDLVRL